MYESISCPTKGKELCKCKPFKEMSADDYLNHVLNSITEIRPELEYYTLTEPEQRTLRILGKCRNCGGALCYCFRVNPFAGEKLLEHLYTTLRLFFDATPETMDRGEIYKLFLRMFREGDKEYAATWAFSRFQSEIAGKTIYTVIKTVCNTEQGLFDQSAAMGSFLSRERAIHEFDRLVEEAKEAFSPEYGRELSSETWWEMDKSSETDIRYTRLQILENELDADAG